MLDFEYKQIKGVIWDILYLIYGLQTGYLQHKNTILSKVLKLLIKLFGCCFIKMCANEVVFFAWYWKQTDA